jgi:hypothetical protein
MSIVPYVRNPNIRRGRMSAADKVEIERLATTMAKPTPGKIARKINRHVSTVNWFMLTRGLIERKPGRIPHSYVRNGITVHPYTEEHDDFIVTLRSQGLKFPKIAELATAQFGIARNQHSVHVRLIQLAAAPDDHLAPPPRTAQLSAP